MAIIRISLHLSPTVPLSHASVQRSKSIGNRLVVFAKRHTSVDLQIKRYDHHKNKVVYEDASAGIVCYTDENGEITSEGYDDEQPRIHDNETSCSSNSREVEIIQLLQRCFVQVADENELETAHKKLATGQKEF